MWITNSATSANACNPSLVYVQNPSWVHFGEESLLSRRSRAIKIPSHSRDIFLLINRFCGERNTPKNTLACAQTALGSGRCAHLSAPWTPCARDSTLHLHRHRAYLCIHIQTGTSHPTPRGQTHRCLGLMDSPGIERTRNSAAL